MTKMIKSYSELSLFSSFEERFKYVKLNGKVGQETFGFERYLNQTLYRSREWRRIRDIIIVRDGAGDLGMLDYVIPGTIYVHHINPITIDDLEKGNPCVFDTENLICSSFNTHNAIHFGDESILERTRLIVRRKGDTSPWIQY